MALSNIRSLVKGDLNVTGSILKHKKWYGRFQDIRVIKIARNQSTATAILVFKKKKTADRALVFSDDAVFTDGRVLKAIFGHNQ